MKKQCDLFNVYRDGNLNPEQKSQFERHMIGCKECRLRTVYLDIIVGAIQSEEMASLPAYLPERIAARAFEKSNKSEFLVFSWLKPASVWSAFGVLLVLVSLLWIQPSVQPTADEAVYDELMTGGNMAAIAGSSAGGDTDDATVAWLGQGGNPQ